MLPESGPVLLHYGFAPRDRPVPAEDELRVDCLATLARTRAQRAAVVDELVARELDRSHVPAVVGDQLQR